MRVMEMLVLYKRVNADTSSQFFLVSDNQWKYTVSNYIRLWDIMYKLVKIADIEENELPKIVDALTKSAPKMVENPLMGF